MPLFTLRRAGLLPFRRRQFGLDLRDKCGIIEDGLDKMEVRPLSLLEFGQGIAVFVVIDEP